MDWKNAARWINYNFVAQTIMSALSGVSSKITLKKDIGVSATQHEKNKSILTFFNSYHYKGYHKAKNWYSTKAGIEFELTIKGKDHLIVTIAHLHDDVYKIHVSRWLGDKMQYSQNETTTRGKITATLHNMVGKYLKADPHQVKTLGALPNGLVFRLKGHRFRVGFQMDITGKWNLDLQSETGSEIFDLSKTEGKQRAISFLLANAGVNSSDPKEYTKQAQQIVSEIAKELAIANKAVKNNKPRKLDPNAPGRAPKDDPNAPIIDNRPYTPRIKKVKVVKPTNTPKKVPGTPIPGTPKTPGKPTKTNRMNKRGFDVVEKRSITYTRKSPSAKLTGVPGVKQPTAKQLAARAKFTKMVKAKAAAKKKIAGYAIKPEKVVGKVAANWWAGLGKIPKKGKVNFALVKNETIAKKLNNFTMASFVPKLKVSVTRGKHLDIAFQVRSSATAVQAIKKYFTGSQIETQEYGGALYLNRQNKILGVYVGFVGGMDAAVIDTRLILGLGLEIAAQGIILFHNHPSGTLAPSEADKRLTAAIKRATSDLDMSFIDHVILTKNGYFSFADDGIL